MGLILCTEKDEAVAHYARRSAQQGDGRKYRLALPDEKKLAEELRSTQRALERRGLMAPAGRRKPKKGG